LSRGDLVAHQFADDLHFDGKPRPSLREKVKSGAGKCANRRSQEPAMSEQEMKLDGPDFAQGCR
jgi:hypothetical protein